MQSYDCIRRYCYKPELGKEMAFRKFLDCLDILKLVKENDIEHIHCHFAREHVEFAYILKQKIGIPFTFTTHAMDIFIKPREDVRKLAENAKKVIAVSEFNRRYMYEKFDIPLEKIEVVTYSKYLDKLIPVKDYKTSPFRLISISRFVEKKGYPYLIKACKILKDKEIEFSCEIQGDGERRQELEKLIKELNLEDSVILGNAMTHEEVLEFIKIGSVFILPCIRADNGDMDGIPNVLMESMAMEIPTISTDVTGIPELIDDRINGIIVPQKNAEALAEAIIKIKNDKEFTEKIRKKGRDKVIQEFNVKKNVRGLMEVFESD